MSSSLRSAPYADGAALGAQDIPAKSGTLGRKRHDHSRSAIVGELGFDATAVQLGDLAADVQPKPESGSLITRLGLIEALEDMWPIVRRDADSMVAHDEPRGTAALC
jgi:hypothetical protein